MSEIRFKTQDMVFCTWCGKHHARSYMVKKPFGEKQYQLVCKECVEKILTLDTKLVQCYSCSNLYEKDKLMVSVENTSKIICRNCYKKAGNMY